MRVMSDILTLHQRLVSRVAEITETVAGTSERGVALLRMVHQLLPYEAAVVTLRDQVTRQHTVLVQDGQTDALEAYFSCSEADGELQRLGLNRSGWPMMASFVPVPLEEICAWRDFLLPAGFRDGLIAGLFTTDKRHLGSLTLITSVPNSVTATTSAQIHMINALVADAIAEGGAAVTTP